MKRLKSIKRRTNKVRVPALTFIVLMFNLYYVYIQYVYIVTYTGQWVTNL